jgi:(p)ppGpp synthase/HD superfamily hydrolase
MNTWSIDDLQDIWLLATRMHDGQKYGGANDGEKIEYLNHIGGVTFEILNALAHEKNMNADLAIKCAVLHDTIEDTELSYEEIHKRFGAQVANGVLALTKDNKISGKDEKMTDSLQRIKLQPQEVWAVKMADRITNLYAPPFYWDNEKKKSYRAEARLIHQELREGNHYLAERLARKIERYSQYIQD